MKTSNLDAKIKGPLLIEQEAHLDQRGFFVERYNNDTFKMAGLPTLFHQDAHSNSMPGVIRGLHFQESPPQGKLIWVASGIIYDVVVDIRPESETFLKWTAISLNSKNQNQSLWVPEGFAHGFCVTSEEPAHVVYKITSPYNPKGESGLLWNDPDLNINWPVKNPILSERDKSLLSVKDLRKRYKK